MFIKTGKMVSPLTKKGNTMKAANKVQSYILAAFEFYDHKQDLITEEAAKVKECLGRFNAEYWYYDNQLHYNGNMQKAMASWLQGLPSDINHAFYYDEIDALLVEWGFMKVSSRESTIEKQRDLYWSYLAGAIISLAKSHKII